MKDHIDRALVTFSYDDGRKNNYTTALPLHENYNIPASFAIISNRAVDPKYWARHMNPAEIVDASRRGVEIASHGVMHQEKFTSLDAHELEIELSESKHVLEGFIYGNNKVNTLCLPFSAVDSSVIGKASQHYPIVRGHGGKLNDPSDGSTFVSSYGLGNFSTFSDVQLLIDDAVSQKKWLVLMLHGVVEEANPEKRHDISRNLLERILQYVDEIGPHLLMPVTFSDVLALRDKASSLPPAERREALPKSGAFTLAETSGYLITYHKNPQPTNTIMITFGGLPSKKTPTGFGSKFALKQGYDHIFVAQEQGSQYQGLGLTEFVKAVQPYLEGKNVVTYGSSLGAYAALYYGGAVNAVIIASAPKNSAHRFMKKDNYSHIVFRHKDLKDVPQSGTPPLILFDPYREEEARFIDRWVTPAYENATLLRIPYAGHTVLDTMQKSGVLKDFITTYVEEREIIPFELEEENSYIWHAEKGRKLLAESEYKISKEHFQASLRLQQNGEAAAGLVRVLLKEGEAESAQEVVDEHFEITGSYKGISAGLRKSIDKRLTSGQ